MDGELTEPIIMFGDRHSMVKYGAKINYISFTPFEIQDIKIDTFEYFLELIGVNPEEVAERTTREEFYKLDNE